MAFAANREFHDLDSKKEEEILTSRPANHRGFHPFAAETTDPKTRPDLREASDTAPGFAEDDPGVLAGKPVHGPNAWPSDQLGFRPTLIAY